MSDFTKLIEKERIRKNMTQKELYKKAGVSSNSYSSFIKTHNSSFENIIKLLFALNMSENIKGLLTTNKFVSIDEIRRQKNKDEKRRIKRSRDEEIT